MVVFARKSEVNTGLIRRTLLSLRATWQRRGVEQGQLALPCRDS
jgi:hypothetical protein